MNWNTIPNLDIDQAVDEIYRNNHTKTRRETIKRMLAGSYRVPEPLKGYQPDKGFKHSQIVLGPFAEKVVAKDLSDGDNVLLQAPDNNNARDLYVISNGKVLNQGYQVKLGDPNEHIYYSLLKRLRHGNRDGIVLDGSLVQGGQLGDAFTPYKRERLQAALDDTKAPLVGVPGMVARAKTLRRIEEGTLPTLNRILLAMQNAYYSKRIS